MTQTQLESIQNFEGKYPKQLWGLFFSEMWERFCFYGMRGMLTFFMVYQLSMATDVANIQYAATQSWVYAFTFIGGMLADKILGFKKSLFWGAILMIVGSFILMLDPHANFFLGISFLIVGTGFFKPNISSMVGQLYTKNDPRRDAGFSMFYSGINIGSFLGGILMVGVGKGVILSSVVPEHLRWNVAFALVGVVMTISLITFLVTKKNLGTIGDIPLDMQKLKNRKWYEYIVYVGAIAAVPLIMMMVSNPRYTDFFMYFIGPFSIIYLIYEMTKLTKEENKKLLAAVIFIVFSVFFWAIFEQAGGSFVIYAAEHVDDTLLGVSGVDPNIVNNSANALFVIILAPVAGLVWLWLYKKKLEPNGVVKFGLGFLFLGLAFYVFYSGQFFSNGLGIASLNIFTLGYLVVTFGELAISPIGLSLMTKLSTAKLQGFMMGMWFLASAYGQYVAGIFGASITPDKSATAVEKLAIYSEGYKDFALYAVISGVLLILISPLVRKLMGDVK